ncbi:MAG: DNA repair exonuclease [Clostridia bacterium]|nr:DNA repair exonuclease [Clostridia bacterium]
MLKILHTGDIHLDSPFSKLDARRAEIRRGELRTSFISMMQYARKNAVDLILIAGDLFDTEFVTRETMALITREFSLFEGSIVISPGNHDCYAPGSVWERTAFSDNVYIFTEPTLSCFSFDTLGADVYGYAFTSPERTDCPLSGAEVNDPTRINLVCAHGDLASPLSRYSPISRSDIVSFGADYTALGHIHNPGAITKEAGAVYGYSGCLEGRGPDEIGPKGAVLLEIDKVGTEAEVHARRIRFSKRRYEEAQIDCTGAETLTAVESAMADEIERRGFGEDTLLRAVLTGAVSPSLIVDTRALQSRFSDLFSVEIRDNTVPFLDPGEFENDRTVRGAFYRAMLEKIESGSPREREIAVLALRYGLAAIAGENVSDL